MDDSCSDDKKDIPSLEETIEAPFNQSGVEQFNCNMCAFTYTGLLDLNSHMELNHRSKEYSGKVISTEAKIETQVPKMVPADIIVRDAEGVICPFCKQSSNKYSKVAS